VRDYATHPTNCGRTQVAPGNVAADGHRPYGRRKNGSKLPIDRYRALLEAAPDAMFIVNRGGEILLLNIQMEKRC
jgi:PAS domain-containing protein